MKQPPRAIIIAGPDGAGKTTFAREFLPLDASCPHFINVDLIAEGLSPFEREAAAKQAARVMQQELQRHFDARHDFALETTLAGHNYLKAIAQWRAAGYRVKAIYLHLDSPELAIARVAARHLTGGHTVPAARIRHDCIAGLRNFTDRYAPCVDAWALYDNSGVWPLLLECSEKSAIESTSDNDLRHSADAMRRAARHAHDMAELTGSPVVVSRNGILENMTSGFDEAVLSVHECRRLYAVRRR